MVLESETPLTRTPVEVANEYQSMWRDTPDFLFNSTEGFRRVEEFQSEHISTANFTRKLLAKGWEITQIRERSAFQQKAVIVIVETSEPDELIVALKGPIEPKVLQAKQRLNYSNLHFLGDRFQSQLDGQNSEYEALRIFMQRERTKSRVAHFGYVINKRELSDKVISMAINGDHEAFTRIYEAYFERIRRYAYGILSRSHTTPGWIDAEDFAQETFERAISALPKYKKYDGVPLNSWLFTIAQHRVKSFLRTAKNRVPRSSIQEHDSVIIPNENTLVELMVVSKHVKDLSQKQQQVLALTAIGYRDQEIAWILGEEKVGNIKGLKHKGRVNLAREKQISENKLITHVYIITLAQRLLAGKVKRGAKFWKEGSLQRSVEASLENSGFRKSQIDSVLREFPPEFLDRMANIHTVPRITP